MRMTLLAVRGLATLAITLAAAAPAAAQDIYSSIPVVVRHVGNDALSVELAGRIESELRRSTGFVLSGGKSHGTLLVTIPASLGAERFGSRVRIFFTVEYSWADGQEGGTRSGSCWNDKLSQCATQIVIGAKGAAGRGAR